MLFKIHVVSFSLGETGAGKSSLLNLIMGEHVLSEEVLSSTSCICRIFNSEQKKAVVKDENGREIEISDVTKKTLSKYVCVDRSEKKSQRYKIVDIYWPVPMLKVTKIFFFLSRFEVHAPVNCQGYCNVCIHLSANI